MARMLRRARPTALYLTLVCLLLAPSLVPARPAVAARQSAVAGSSATSIGLVQPSLAASSGATLVKDLTPGSDPASSSSPREFTTIGSITYFLATDGSNGRELWKTDGSNAGTRLVKDIHPGAASAFNDSDINPAGLTNVAGTLFFANSNSLWKSDGSATGTVTVRTFVSGQSALKLYGLAAVGNLLFFRTDDGNGNHGLWRSDGSAVGTFQLKANARFPDFDIIVDVGGIAMFAVGGGLWRSDGSVAGTTLVKAVPPLAMVSAKGSLIFTVYDADAGRGVWKSDGTTVGTIQISAEYPQFGLSNVNGTIYFSTTMLWKTDGTAAGTVQVSFVPQNAGNLTYVNGTFFFIALGSQGQELWKSDGTDAGTTRVKDLRPGWTGDRFDQLTSVNGILFFVLDQRVANIFVYELWRSDGTEAGTFRVLQTAPGANAPGELLNANGTLIFAGNNVANGSEPWKSDGTAAGTALIKDIGISLGQTFGSGMIGVNNKLFFVHGDANGNELWISDGTDVGTHLLKDINSGPASSNPDWLTASNNTLLFIADDGAHGTELWKSDGTANGTTQVKDITAGATSSRLLSLTPVGNTVYFTSGDSNNELWKTNGTAAGTVLIKDFGAGAANHYLVGLTSFNNTLLFSADDDTHGRELWQSNGTSAGTVMLKDIIPGTASSEPIDLTNASGTLFFATSTNHLALQLWKSDGTAAGTVFVKDIPPDQLGYGINSIVAAQGQLFYIAGDGGQGYALWHSDGTTAGTLPIKPAQITQLDAVGTDVFFANDDGVHGTEPWKSDGTAAGTTQIADIAAGPSSSLAPFQYRRVVQTGAGIVFVASNGETGMELWRSNGAEAGTLLLDDIAPGTGSADPGDLTIAGSQLFFMADDNIHGRELWVMPLPQIQPQPPVSISGPTTGVVEANNTFTANVSPSTTTLPITYVWQADGQANVAHTGGLADTAMFSWSTPGTRTITVTASNSNGLIGTNTHSVAIADAPQITPAAGGVATFPGLELTFPPGAVVTGVNILYTPLSAPTHPLEGELKSVSVFRLEARDLNNQPVTHFAKPYTVLISYTDEQLAALGIAEADLNLAFWNGSAWVNVLPCAGCGVDTINNRLTAVLDHFTEFALFSGVPTAGDGKIRVYLPMARR